MSSPWSIVARTEYAEGVRSPWFLFTTFVVPVLFAAMAVFSAGLESHVRDRPARVALVDESVPPLGDEVRAALQESRGTNGAFFVEIATQAQSDRIALEARVSSGELEGFLVLPPDTLRAGRVLYRGTNASSLGEMGRLSSAVRSAVVAARARGLGLKERDLNALLADVSVDAEQSNGSASKASGSASFLAAYVAAVALYMCILLYGVTVARAVVQEKTTRIMELLVACARPWDLMVGKIVGVGSLGLTQMGIWLSALLALVHFRGPVLERFGVEGGDRIALPDFGAGEIAIILVYFLGGFFLYASLFAAVGAASTSDREAQQSQMPVALPMVAAFLCYPAVTSNPRGGAAVILTLVPLLSPVLMPMRYLLTPLPPWQLALSLGLLLAAIAGTAWLGSRVYRVGILMYGKKPTLRELARWIRAS